MENTIRNHTWSRNGAKHYFDISDSECMKRINLALEELRENYEATAGSEKNTPEEIERVCGMIGEFFKAVFGEDEVAVICGDRNSFEAYMGAYIDFIMFVNEQLEALKKFREDVDKRVTEKFATRIAELGGAEAVVM